MAAPSHTALGTPAGITLKNGFSTAFSFSALTTLSLWEEECDVPGLVGGGAIMITNMRNSRYRTKYPKSLIEIPDIEGVFQYDPNVLNQGITSVLQVNQSITCWLSDLSYVDFWGWLDEIKPQRVKEGDQPKCNVKIIVSNFDQTNHVEAGPVIVSVPGT